MGFTFDHVYGFYCDPFVLRRLAPDHDHAILSYGYLATRLSLQHADHGTFPPLRWTTVTLLPSTSKIPMQAEYIRVPTLNELSPSTWSPSARSSPGATTCFGSATITIVFSP